MKKLALTVVTIAALAAVTGAPAEAHGLRFHHRGIGLGVGLAVATAAAIAADTTYYGPYGYYYGPAPVYYGAPVYVAPRFRY